MTIAVAWVAVRSDGREDLYFAADSRTRGIRVLDVSPKILTLPRSDCAICFSGDIDAAYPLMLQVAAAIAAHEPARNRNLDIAELKHHILRLITDIVSGVRVTYEEFNAKNVQFIFGGYSWRTKNFRLWTIYFEESSSSFRAREAITFHKLLFKATFIGDWATRYRTALHKELGASGTKSASHEPLKVLANLLIEAKPDDSIGGSPQVIRIGPHMNTRPLCVLWGAGKDRYLFGRKLFDYEHCDYWAIDPDTGSIFPPKHFAIGDAHAQE